MKIVIVGAGFTGTQLARLLTNEKNTVSLIDNDEETARHASNRLDCEVMVADGNNLETLERAGVAKADALVCVTKSDEINMITCSLVDAVYPDVLKIARVRNYAYYLNTARAFESRASSPSASSRPLYGVDCMIHPDVEAAEAIAQAVKHGAVNDVVAFDGSDYVLTRMTVSPGSVFAGKKLSEARALSGKKFLTAYIEKDGKTTLPSGESVLEAGCGMGVVVSKEGTAALLALCGSEQKELRDIVIVGAGRIGTIVAERLMRPKQKSFFGFFKNIKLQRPQNFFIIDSDEKLAKAAAERFKDARVFCADATDDAFLREEGVTKFDLAICATHNHELNMVMAAYLESLGVGQSAALVESAAFALIARKLGVDVAVPLRDTIVDSIMSHLRGKSVKGVHTVSTGDLEIIECVVSDDSKVIGKTLREIADPGIFLLLLAKKNGSASYEIPEGGTTLGAKDHVILIAQSESDGNVVALFGGKNSD